jgi:hypothetical protein
MARCTATDDKKLHYSKAKSPWQQRNAGVVFAPPTFPLKLSAEYQFNTHQIPPIEAFRSSYDLSRS